MIFGKQKWKTSFSNALKVSVMPNAFDLRINTDLLALLVGSRAAAGLQLLQNGQTFYVSSSESWARHV